MENYESNPSILYILLPELDDFLKYLTETLLPEIDEGLKTKKLAYTPGSDWPLHPSFADFWEHQSIFMLDSGTFRMRALHKAGKCYQFFLNNPGSNPEFPKFHGEQTTAPICFMWIIQKSTFPTKGHG
jgi:hypothetical protein